MKWGVKSITQSSESLWTHVVALTVKTSGWGINSYRIWEPCYVVQTISFINIRAIKVCGNLTLDRMGV